MTHRGIKKFVCREDYPLLETGEGKYRGFLDGDVFCFRGIHYGEAKRFQDPLPPKAFKGIRNALDYGPVDPVMSYRTGQKAMENDILVRHRLWFRDENCLNLNIWTPSLERDAGKPVMVWMHGGGFAGGNALDLFSYDGWEMSHCYDVAVVTVNHRLNMSGYLDLSAYGEQYAHTGILGMLDLVAALRWVHENAAAFGGDPENVTIYGQSGGGTKVTTLMQMPSADGLYQKAIVQSGVFPAGTFRSRSGEAAELVVKSLGLTDNVEKLESMDYEELGKTVEMACYAVGSNPFEIWGPTPDGKEYIGNPLETGFRKETENIPVIIGSCLSEFDPSPVGVQTEERCRQCLQETFEEQADIIQKEFENVYPGINPVYAACLDTMVRPAVTEFLSRRNREARAAVYNYIFAFETPLMGGQLTGHNGDLHFMFHNAAYLPAMCRPGITDRLQNEMAGAWAAFARTGTPNGEGLPQWLPYDEEKRNCMVYADETRLREIRDDELLRTVRNARKM